MKLIIDIPDTAYEAYKEWHKQGVSNVEQSLIALAMPYEEKPKYFPPCEDCNKKMEEIRQAYDKMKAMERPQGEWIDYDNTFYKCPECGYLLEKDCPCCQNKVILPKGGAE